MSNVAPNNKGKVAWNDGKITKLAFESPGEGWVRGRAITEKPIPAGDQNVEPIKTEVKKEPIVAGDGLISSVNRSANIGFFKLREQAVIPKYQTQASAGFDLHAALVPGETITAYNLNNRKIDVPVKGGLEGAYFVALPGLRYLVPTGLVFDTPKDHMVEIHPRSGISLKQGIVLANCTGIIDSDYVEEVFVMTLNISDMSVVIRNGERIAQGIVAPISQPKIEELKTRPSQKTDRNGGLGSTGV